MTLDIFQKDMEALATKFQQEMIALLTKGLEAKLDGELLIAIVTREMAKLEQTA